MSSADPVGRIHLIAGGVEVARRRKLVPVGRLVEVWPDLGTADHVWVGGESKALLDATGTPLDVGSRCHETVFLDRYQGDLSLPRQAGQRDA